jgi:glycosyltransferase involved in cell wall biosynthesis
MKITQIMLAKGFGGAERLFVDLCLSLAEAGLDVQAICLTGSRSAQVLSQHPEVRLRTMSVLGVWDPFAPGKIRVLLQQHKSQIVQAHLARGAFLAGKTCQKQAIPLVVTTHNYINTKYYKNVTVLVPPTRDQYAYYLGKGVAAERMKIINHFSPIEPTKKITDSKSTTLRMVTLGRLVRKKGYHVLLEAFARLEEKTGSLCELHIGGTGPEQQALLTQIKTLGLDDKVTLSGWVDDVASFLQDGDLFVLPSLDEPFGIVVLEAMALGLPIVSSDSQGPTEILDEDCAWLVKTGDAESLAAALCKACDNAEERKRKAENALQRFKQSYSKQAIIPEFMALFDSLLAARTKASPR